MCRLIQRKHVSLTHLHRAHLSNAIIAAAASPPHARTTPFRYTLKVNLTIDPATASYQSGLLGGFLRAVGVAVYDPVAAVGFESLTFAPALNETHQVLVRIRCTMPNAHQKPTSQSKDDGERKRRGVSQNISRGVGVTTCPWRYFRASINHGWAELSSPTDVSFFYSELLKHHDGWNAVFNGSLSVSLPGTETPRQFDMARGAVALVEVRTSHISFLGGFQMP
jgi:hypothetical protein